MSDAWHRVGGERLAQAADVAYARCPQKVSAEKCVCTIRSTDTVCQILKFYEAHLK